MTPSAIKHSFALLDVAAAGTKNGALLEGKDWPLRQAKKQENYKL